MITYQRSVYLPDADGSCLQVLSNHVVATKLDAASVTAAIEAASPNPAKVTTLAATTLEAASDADGILVAPQDTDIMARVVVADVETCAGVVHVIDKVLVPAALDTTEENPDKFVVWTAYAGKDYSPKEHNAVMVEVALQTPPSCLLPCSNGSETLKFFLRCFSMRSFVLLWWVST